MHWYVLWPWTPSLHMLKKKKKSREDERTRRFTSSGSSAVFIPTVPSRGSREGCAEWNEFWAVRSTKLTTILLQPVFFLHFTCFRLLLSTFYWSIWKWEKKKRRRPTKTLTRLHHQKTTKTHKKPNHNTKHKYRTQFQSVFTQEHSLTPNIPHSPLLPISPKDITTISILVHKLYGGLDINK